MTGPGVPEASPGLLSEAFRIHGGFASVPEAVAYLGSLEAGCRRWREARHLVSEAVARSRGIPLSRWGWPLLPAASAAPVPVRYSVPR